MLTTQCFFLVNLLPPHQTLPYCQRALDWKERLPHPPAASQHSAPYLHAMLARWLILASHQTVIMGESAALSSLQLGTCHHATIPRMLGWDRKRREEGFTGVRGITPSSPPQSSLPSTLPPHRGAARVNQVPTSHSRAPC